MGFIKRLLTHVQTKCHKKITELNCQKTVNALIRQVNERNDINYYDLKMTAALLFDNDSNIIHPIAFCVSVIHATNDSEKTGSVAFKRSEVRDLLILFWQQTETSANNIVLMADLAGLLEDC